MQKCYGPCHAITRVAPSLINQGTPRAHSTNAQHDFHQCQERAGLQQHKIDQDCPTRWRGSHMMADQLVYNKPAVLEMDKDPAIPTANEALTQIHNE